MDRKRDHTQRDIDAWVHQMSLRGFIKTGEDGIARMTPKGTKRQQEIIAAREGKMIQNNG